MLVCVKIGMFLHSHHAITRKDAIAHLVGISFIRCDLGRAVETMIYEFKKIQYIEC